MQSYILSLSQYNILDHFLNQLHRAFSEKLIEVKLMKRSVCLWQIVPFSYPKELIRV
jgi:hypothetical protein